MRVLAPAIGIIFFLYYILKPEFLLQWGRVLFLEGGFFESSLMLALITLSTARMAAPRVWTGLAGWERHLPVSGEVQRRSAALAVFVAQLPVLIVLGYFALVSSGKSVSFISIAGVFVLGLSSAVFVLPVQNKLLPKPLAGIACLLVPSRNWYFLAAALLFLAAADLSSGRLLAGKKRARYRAYAKGHFFHFFICWRSLRWRILFPYLPSLLILAGTSLFLANNAFPPKLSLMGIRFGAFLSLTLFFAVLSHQLTLRRPVWPWMRSLPRSSKQRVILDAGFECFQAIPLILVAAWMDIRVIWTVLAFLPLLSLRAASAMRSSEEQRLSVSGKIFVEGFILSLLGCLFNWIALVYLALTPLELFRAASEERRQKASRWAELRHLSAGDSLSWSGQ